MAQAVPAVRAGRIEGIGNVLESEAWKDAVFLRVLSMERVNAAAIDARRNLTPAEKALIEKLLLEFEALIIRFEIA